VQGQCGHIIAEDDLFRRSGVVEVCHGTVGFIKNRIRSNAGGKSALVVGVALQQIFIDAVYGWLSNLGSAGIVEEDSGRLSDGNWLRIADRSMVM